MSNLKSFTASGSCSDKEMLKKTILFVMSYLNYGCNIVGYSMDKLSNSESKSQNILVFYAYKSEHDCASLYPFKIEANNEEGIDILAAHIVNYIKSLNSEDLTELNCDPSGYEEDYEIGWEIFIPKWGDEEYSINSYTWGKTVLAVKPKFIEHGK